MKRILIVCLLATMTFTCGAQEIKNGPLTIDQACWTDFAPIANGSSVFTTSTRTVTNGGTDTANVKVIGGTPSNKLHYWITATKTSGTTDSMLITLWGVVTTGCGSGRTTTYKSLYTDQTANATGAQLFTHLISNDYTNYMITVKRISVLTTAQVSTYKYTFLAR